MSNIIYTRLDQLAPELKIEECVRWGVICTWDILRGKETTQDGEALDACVRWYRDPSEEHRLEARAKLEKADFETPAGMLLRAVYFTGNVAPDGCPAVTLESNTPRLMVAACLDMLLATVPIVQRDSYVSRFEELKHQLAVCKGAA